MTRKGLLVLFLFTLSCTDKEEETTPKDFWNHINGSISGKVSCLAVDFDDVVYAGVNGDGIYRSQNDGADWEKISDGLPSSPTINSIAVNSNNTVFLAEQYQGVYRSLDQGGSWTKINNGILDIDTFSIIAIAINSSDHVFAGTNRHGSIYRSTDNGDSWSFVGGVSFLNCFAINSNDHIFAGLTNGMCRSTDNGEKFRQIHDGLPDPYRVLSIAINVQNHIFIGSAGTGIYRSQDNGDSWQEVNSTLHQTHHSMAINSEGHIYCGIYKGGVLSSTDNASSWNPVNSGLPDSVSVYSLALDSKGYLYAGTYEEGIYRSTQSTVTVRKEKYLFLW